MLPATEFTSTKNSFLLFIRLMIFQPVYHINPYTIATINKKIFSLAGTSPLHPGKIPLQKYFVKAQHNILFVRNISYL